MNQEKRMEQIGGEDGWELDADEEAALERAWAAERTPEFFARIKRQEAEYDIWLETYKKENGIQSREIKVEKSKNKQREKQRQPESVQEAAAS